MNWAISNGEKLTKLSQLGYNNVALLKNLTAPSLRPLFLEIFIILFIHMPFAIISTIIISIGRYNLVERRYDLIYPAFFNI